MTKHVRYALVVAAVAIVMIAVDVLLDMDSIAYAGLYIMGMASGIWMGGELK